MNIILAGIGSDDSSSTASQRLEWIFAMTHSLLTCWPQAQAAAGSPSFHQLRAASSICNSNAEKSQILPLTAPGLTFFQQVEKELVNGN